ncbi:MAG: CARDB domain-containing protein [bacterium]
MDKTKSVLKTSTRIIIIGIIVVVLIFLSFLMVSVVPKVLSSMANATVSVTSALFPGGNSTSTNSTSATNSTSSGITFNNPAPIKNSDNSGRNNNGYNSSNNSTGNNSTNNPTGNKRTYDDRNPNTNYQKVSGTPDLSVQITSIGISGTNGIFVATNNISTSDTVIVKFTVENQGTGASGPWSMKVNMPSNNASDQVRTISANSLSAGAAVSGQAVFNNPTVGTNQQVTISIDPNGSILESNKNNNQTSVTLNVTQANNYYNNHNYNNNYNCVNGYTNGIYTNCNNTNSTYNNGNYNNNYNCVNGYTNGVYTNCNNNGGYGYNAGLPNLVINFVALGKIDSYYNQFTETNYLRSSDKVAVKFTVTNNSSVYTSSWTWKATLFGPNQYANNYYNTNYINGYTYNTDGSRTYMPTVIESGLAPGETRTYTVNFDGLTYGSNYITIVIDPSNNITESNKADNSISQSFTVSN